MTEIVVSCKNLNFSFSDSLIFRDFGMKVKAGEKIALAGPSGRGKSTLLNILVGFLPQYTGEIQVFGMPLIPENIRKIRSRIAWLPQETTLHFDTAREAFYAMFSFRRNAGLKPDKSAIRQLFQDFDLPYAILDKKFTELSGGQKQRLMLAAVLLSEKPLVFIDEPTSALDEDLKQKVSDRVLHSNTTIIASVHDPYWIEASDRIIEL